MGYFLTMPTIRDVSGWWALPLSLSEENQDVDRQCPPYEDDLIGEIFSD